MKGTLLEIRGAVVGEEGGCEAQGTPPVTSVSGALFFDFLGAGIPAKRAGPKQTNVQ
jgi:hypothetical protein